METEIVNGLAQYGSTMDAIFAFLALIYLIAICVNFDSAKRSIGTQIFITIINAGLVASAFLTHSMFLLAMWVICLVINGLTLKWKINGEI